jgi:hypothetical protein
MANLASYGGYKYDCLNTRYEGHVGNRNPILGTGHTSYDEPAYDVEGNKGAGTRGPKHLAHYREWHTAAPSSTSSSSPAPYQHAPNPHHSDGQYRTTHARRDSYLNLAKQVKAEDFQQAVGGAPGGKRLYGVGENINRTGSGGHTYQGTPSKMHVARDVNVNLRKAHPHSNGHGRQSQQPTPAQTFFNSSNPAHTRQQQQQQQQQQQKAAPTPAFRGEKNPITGEGHTAYDERNMDLDGRVGAGTRGVDGNRSYNPHRNVITGEGLRAYLSKNHSSQKVEDGECDSYAYYKDRWVSGKEMGGTYTPTAQLQWSHQKYEPHAMPKQWNWSN